MNIDASIAHNVRTGKNMDAINMAAFTWFARQGEVKWIE
jgi:hypothetical protein